MHEKSRDSKMATVKRVLQEHREQQIADVQQTIVQLTHLYARVITLGPESNETELSRLRTELDDSLAFAKKVDEQIRMSTPDSDVDLSKFESSTDDSHNMTTHTNVESQEERNYQ